ncbi:MAG: formate dehydrogenase accessory sulfurtransferase FdhD [Thermodesulfovibrionales bacterium]|nr:formate dehydrogenase accessory sulfurtransferase FdhD [Thermodesulfovibrionales bacterium]
MFGSIKRDVYRVAEGLVTTLEDVIALEKRLKISVNGLEILSLYCTPLMIRELVVGILMTEEIIKGSWCSERMSILYGEEVEVDIAAEGEVLTEGGVITSGCIGGITFPKRRSLRKIEDNSRIPYVKIIELFKIFQRSSELFNLTGCVHSAAITDGDNIICLAEDIGRHNAVDKTIGYMLLEKIPFEHKIMLASGRLSSEIVSKCAKWGIPIVASRTAPTSLAVEIAEKTGVTLIGFVRGKRMNIYTYHERVIIQ